jgi:hypothetical protein
LRTSGSGEATVPEQKRDTYGGSVRIKCALWGCVARIRSMQSPCKMRPLGNCRRSDFHVMPRATRPHSYGIFVGRAARISHCRFDYLSWRALVRAALRAAAERPAMPLVRTPFRAAAERSESVRRKAARRAWRDRAASDAVFRGSCLRTRETVRDTRGRRWVLRLC